MQVHQPKVKEPHKPYKFMDITTLPQIGLQDNSLDQQSLTDVISQ